MLSRTDKTDVRIVLCFWETKMAFENKCVNPACDYLQTIENAFFKFCNFTPTKSPLKSTISADFFHKVVRIFLL